MTDKGRSVVIMKNKTKTKMKKKRRINQRSETNRMAEHTMGGRGQYRRWAGKYPDSKYSMDIGLSRLIPGEIRNGRRDPDRHCVSHAGFPVSICRGFPPSVDIGQLSTLSPVDILSVFS